MKQTPKTLLTLSALAGLSFTAAQAAVIWDGGATGSWNTTTNWNPDGLPGSADDVTIENAAVTINEGNFDIKSLSLIDSSLDGIDSNTNGAVIRWVNGATVISVDKDSNLGTSNDFYDMRGVTLNFESGAKADLGTWEFKNSSKIAFELDAGGFTTIGGAGRLKTVHAANLYTWEVDMAAYAGGAGTITLLDFASELGSINMTSVLFDTGTLSILNAGTTYAGSTLSWDEATLAVQLNVIPESGTYALIGGMLALGYVMVRRRR